MFLSSCYAQEADTRSHSGAVTAWCQSVHVQCHPRGSVPSLICQMGSPTFLTWGWWGGGTVHGVSVLTPPKGPRQRSTNIVLIIRIISTIVIIRGR